MSGGQFPWGTGTVLTKGKNYKVKKISINPNSRQSYQMHNQRAESWVILSGNGKITIDDEETEVSTAAIVLIPIQTKHRIENVSDTEALVFIETQFGAVIDEHDIVRFEDDYGRCRHNWTREDDAELYD